LSVYLDYLHGLRALAAEDRADPLTSAIQARLRGPTEPASAPVSGMVPPPLDRDEPDLAAVLMHLYRELGEAGDERARHRMRRSLVELVSSAFHRAEPLDYIDRLGRLVGFCQVREDPDLADGLRSQIWGHLDGGLSRPLEQFLSLDGEALERASRALDLWVSLVPPMAPVPQHHRERVEDLFKAWRPQLGQWTLDATRFHALMLLFRALLKVSPFATAKEHLTDMAKEVARISRRDQVYERRWLGLCWEIGILLKGHKDWRDELARGVRQMRRDGDPPGLLLTSLGHLDGLDRDFKASDATHTPLTQRRSVAKLSVVR
jgi:hypothetical protein